MIHFNILFSEIFPHIFSPTGVSFFRSSVVIFRPISKPVSFVFQFPSLIIFSVKLIRSSIPDFTRFPRLNYFS